MNACRSRIPATIRPLLMAIVIGLSVGFATIMAQEADADIEVTRPRIDVTAFTDLTTTLPGLLALEASEQIGPGSALMISIPGEGRFGCTANFIWEGGQQLYLGAAGHCFLPAAMKATHGDGADYDASGVDVRVCVNNCDANFQSMTLVGDLRRFRLRDGVVRSGTAWVARAWRRGRTDPSRLERLPV